MADGSDNEEADEDVKPAKSKGRVASMNNVSTARKKTKKAALSSENEMSNDEVVKPLTKRRAPRKRTKVEETDCDR